LKKKARMARPSGLKMGVRPNRGQRPLLDCSGAHGLAVFPADHDRGGPRITAAGATREEVAETVFIAAALRAGGAVTHEQLEEIVAALNAR